MNFLFPLLFPFVLVAMLVDFIDYLENTYPRLFRWILTPLVLFSWVGGCLIEAGCIVETVDCSDPEIQCVNTHEFVDCTAPETRCINTEEDRP